MVVQGGGVQVQSGVPLDLRRCWSSVCLDRVSRGRVLWLRVSWVWVWKVGFLTLLQSPRSTSAPEGPGLSTERVGVLCLKVFVWTLFRFLVYP